MKIRLLTCAVTFALLAVTACGGDPATDGATTDFQLTSGEYALSQVKPVEGDDCQLSAALSDAQRRIAITQSNGAVTFNLNDDPGADSELLATATLEGNQLISPVRALYVTNPDANGCTLMVDQLVTGQVTADNTLALRLDVVYADASDQPGACTPDDVHTLRMPCDSSFTFTATRAP